jgi:hypothetical protein
MIEMYQQLVNTAGAYGPVVALVPFIVLILVIVLVASASVSHEKRLAQQVGPYEAAQRSGLPLIITFLVLVVVVSHAMGAW